MDFVEIWNADSCMHFQKMVAVGQQRESPIIPHSCNTQYKTHYFATIKFVNNSVLDVGPILLSRLNPTHN